jgi:glucose-6-phosphate dehydrogenase assembly protein OpcA
MTSLLAPEGAILRDPADVERALATLWQPKGEEAAEQKGTKTTTRVCMANLVVVGRAREWDDLSQVLADLAEEYPTRTLVLLLGDSKFSASPVGEVRASVSLVCHLPHPGHPQVCGEQIVLRSGSTAGAGVDRAILPLLASDVPLVLWWTTDPALCGDLLRGLHRLADRLVMDAGLPGFAYLQHEGPCVTRELGWIRAYRWRVLIAQLFDEAGGSTFAAIDRVAVTIRGGVPSDRLDAIWMVAFLAGQLGWRPVRVVSDGVYEFASLDRRIEVSILVVPGPGSGLESFVVGAGDLKYEFARCGEGSDEFRIMISDQQACQMSRSVHMARRRRSTSLAIGLTGRSVDHSFERAAPIGSWIARSMLAT